MERLESHLDTNSAEFRANAEHHRALADDLRRRLEAVRQGGGADAVKKHTLARQAVRARARREAARPRHRVPRTSPLAANGMYDDEAPGAGLVTGIGMVHGRT